MHQVFLILRQKSVTCAMKESHKPSVEISIPSLKLQSTSCATVNTPEASIATRDVDLKSGTYTRTHTFRVSKTIRAPFRFVYDWCTDYRENDPEITGSKAKRRILSKADRRVIYISAYMSGGKRRSAVNVVTLYPPKSWHLDFIGDEDDETGDYVLTKLGPRRTRLDMTFTEHYKIREAPTRAQDAKHTHEVWDKYVAALQEDCAR